MNCSCLLYDYLNILNLTKPSHNLLQHTEQGIAGSNRIQRSRGKRECGRLTGGSPYIG